MILTCPACAARYVVDPAALGRDGRRVRCARCRETWYQEAPFVAEPAPTEPPAGLPAATNAEAEPDPAPPAEGAKPPLPFLRDRDDAPVGSAMENYRSRLPAVIAEPPDSRLSLAAGWIGLAVAAALLIAGGALFQPRIVSIWPEAARLYVFLGTLPRSKASPLALSQVSLARGMADGNPILTLTGQIANVSGAKQKLPRFRLELRDAAHKPLRTVEFTINRAELAAGQHMAFATAMPSPPDAAVSAVVVPVTP
jgi:predicted Zn finger-like uncharacterized protein